MVGTVRYDATRNTIYVTTDEIFKESALVEFVETKWNPVVENINFSNPNLVIDMRNITEPHNWFPLNEGHENNSDPARLKGYYGCFRRFIKNHGSGKIVIVCSPQKGNSPQLIDVFAADATLYEVEDAEHFIATGHGVSHTEPEYLSAH